MPEPVFEHVGLVSVAYRERFDAPLWQQGRLGRDTPPNCEPFRGGKAERAASVPRPW